MQKIQVYDKLVVPIANKREFLETVIDRKAILIALHVGKLFNSDPAYVALINEHIGYPDGISIARALRQKGVHSIKYPGHKIWLDLIESAHDEKVFALVGAREAVLRQSVAKLRERFPELRLPIQRNGYMNASDIAELTRMLRTERPDIVFLAMTSPRQDFLMKELFDAHPALYVGLGGALDLYTGRVREPPSWWTKYVGWETGFRILQEPRRAPILRQTVKFLYCYYRKKL